MVDVFYLLQALAKCSPVSDKTTVKMVKRRVFAEQFAYCPTRLVLFSFEEDE